MSRPDGRPRPPRRGPASPSAGAAPVPSPAAALAPAPRATVLTAAAALLLGAFFGVYRQSPPSRSPQGAGGLAAFFSPYVCNDDARQQLYWMTAFHDSALFQNDVVVDYAAHYVTPFVKALYWLLTRFWPPLLAGKFVAVALMALGAYWSCRTAEKLAGPAAGLAAAMLFASSVPVADRVAGGNPRAFMYPLLAAWLCMLVHRRHVATACVAVVSAGTYPMAFLLGAPAWLLDAVGWQGRRPCLDHSRRRWMATACGLGIGAAVMGAKYLSVDPRFGPVADRQRVLNDPAFRHGGRFAEVLGDGQTRPLDDVVLAAGAPFGLRGRWDGLSWVRGNPGWSRYALAGLAAAWLATAAAGVTPLPRAFVALLLSSLLFYALAWALLFRLFVPTRYLQFSLPLLVLIGQALLLTAWTRRVTRAGPRRVATAAALLCTAAAAYGQARIRQPVPHISLAQSAGLWQRIADVVPPDAVVAGPPTLLDSLGAFARRRAYMPDELAHPAYTAYYDGVVVPRIRRTFEALFAERPADVLRFAREERVDYLLFDANALRSGAIQYHKPFDELIRRLHGDGRPRCLLDEAVARRNLLNAWSLRLIRISPGPGNAFGIETDPPP